MASLIRLCKQEQPGKRLSWWHSCDAKALEGMWGRAAPAPRRVWAASCIAPHRPPLLPLGKAAPGLAAEEANEHQNLP